MRMEYNLNKILTILQYSCNISIILLHLIRINRYVENFFKPNLLAMLEMGGSFYYNIDHTFSVCVFDI